MPAADGGPRLPAPSRDSCGDRFWSWRVRKHALPWSACTRRAVGARLPCIQVMCLPAVAYKGARRPSTPGTRPWMQPRMRDFVVPPRGLLMPPCLDKHVLRLWPVCCFGAPTAHHGSQSQNHHCRVPLATAEPVQAPAHSRKLLSQQDHKARNTMTGLPPHLVRLQLLLGGRKDLEAHGTAHLQGPLQAVQAAALEGDAQLRGLLPGQPLRRLR